MISRFPFQVKVLLLSLVFSSSLMSADTKTCYSVQLASIYNKNSIYFYIDKFPTDCKMISLSNLKAVRCGCFDDKTQALVSLKDHRKKYRGAILVKTYSHRFKTQDNIAVQQIKLEGTPDKSTPLETKISEKEEESAPTTQAYVPKYKSLIKDFDFSIQGHVDITAQGYITRPHNKHKANLTTSGEIEFQFSKDDLTLVGNLYAQADSHDVKGSSEKNERTFARIQELYITQDFDNDQILLGKSIRFWGALEAYNITDVFNVEDFRSDIFNPDKLGAWNATYTHYTDTGELSLIVKLYEEDRQMANNPYVYYFFPATVPVGPAINAPLFYDSDLQKELSNRPSFYITYSGSTDTEHPLDYAIIFENGYDNQRYYTNKPSTDGSSVFTQQNAYFVNKIMTYNTLVFDSTLYKLEASYTDVISSFEVPILSGETKKLSDYYQLSLGAEHTLTQFHGDADLGLIAEYYKYDTTEGNDVLTDINLFQVFQNDLFLGGRYSLNEGNDASIIGGIIVDLDYHEQVYYIEYEGRIYDTFKLNMDYHFIKPSSDTLTAYHLLGKHQRLSVKLGYYF